MKAETTESFLEKFRRARLAGTPLIAISCPDPAATIEGIQGHVTDNNRPRAIGEPTIPIIEWTIMSGWQPRNREGHEALQSSSVDHRETINPVGCLKYASTLPSGTILFLHNFHHFLDQPAPLQAMWDLRDVFKSNHSTLITVGPSYALPEQLRSDVLVLDEPLPSSAELRNVIRDVIEGADVRPDEIGYTQPVEAAAVNALRGLARFPAEQSVAMSLRKSGLNVDELWDWKRQLIDGTPGLKAYAGTEKFDSIGGCDQIKKYLSGVINGREAPNVIVFIDEGEKVFAGATGEVGDSSGVAQDFLATTLTYMEDNQCDGAILVGPPGAAKSAMAKAMGNEAGVPTIMLDLGGMKGSLVGKSEAQLREAFKVISAVSGGQAFFIMTCNRIVQLPPELRRRFTSGIFFFDLPTEDEREKIWDIYFRKYNLERNSIMDVGAVTAQFDEGWTGAEIRNCVRMAYRQRIKVQEASKFIVPVSKSAAGQIQELRRQASGAYLSANTEGVYVWEENAMPARKKSRAVNLKD